MTGERLNEYGDFGWELVTIEIGYETLKGTTDRPTRFYIFKRCRESEGGES